MRSFDPESKRIATPAAGAHPPEVIPRLDPAARVRFKVVDELRSAYPTGVGPRCSRTRIPPGGYLAMSLPLLFVLVIASVAAAALSIAYALARR